MYLTHPRSMIVNQDQNQIDDIAALATFTKDVSTEALSAEVARLTAELTLPKPTVHIVSDVHGEDKKLRHIINNASGRLRPVVEQLFGAQRSPQQIQDLLRLLFYPRETLQHVEWKPESAEARRVFRDVLDVACYLAKTKPYERLRKIFPQEQRELLEELLFDRMTRRGDEYVDTVLNTFSEPARFVRFVRIVVRVVRNLAVDELVVAGDLYDRGPRGDRVVDYLLPLPDVRITWGNHDIAWMGAALGSEALIANVMRISLRYNRLEQLIEGYGIPTRPLQKLVKSVYADDPASCFFPKNQNMLDSHLTAQMQKAIAIIQHKLEGQLIERNPDFNLSYRRFLHTINTSAGTVRIDNVDRTLKDTYLPTIDPQNPYQLSSEEQECMDFLKKSFLSSDKLWQHVQFLVKNGSMSLVRDQHLIFHGCVPVEEDGHLQSFTIDGYPCKGRLLFSAFENIVTRSLETPSTHNLDHVWYLWCGPRSPLFGKDRIATFERDLVEEKETHKEVKNAYFAKIHDPDFCARVLNEFNVDPGRGMIVNGHVPVKIEKGEDPLKKSKKAITIDGAFSEAYGDHGYTLVLEPNGTYLAKHHHFDSVTAAVRDGIDIIPELTEVQHWTPPRRVADTEKGRQIRAQIELLRRIAAVRR